MSLETALENIGDDIIADLKEAWADAENVTEQVITTCWNGVKPALTAIAPTLLADAVRLAQDAVAQLGSGAAVGEVVTQMLNSAENQGKQEVTTIESNLLNAIASIHLSAAITSDSAVQADKTVAAAGAQALANHAVETDQHLTLTETLSGSAQTGSETASGAAQETVAGS